MCSGSRNQRLGLNLGACHAGTGALFTKPKCLQAKDFSTDSEIHLKCSLWRENNNSLSILFRNPKGPRRAPGHGPQFVREHGLCSLRASARSWGRRPGSQQSLPGATDGSFEGFRILRFCTCHSSASPKGSSFPLLQNFVYSFVAHSFTNLIPL